LKYYLKNLEEFHWKLSELQQLEDELENNIQKWHWAGHIKKYLCEWAIALHGRDTHPFWQLTIT
jgi:hypothetical protein